MKQFKILGLKLFEWGDTPIANTSPVTIATHEAIKPNNTPLPSSRISKPDISYNSYQSLGDRYKFVNPDFMFEVIPIIRKLAIVNQDLSQAISNITELGNTGHWVKFDPEVDNAYANEMRKHLETKKLDWAEGVSGMDGLVNKMFNQIMIAGALSNEWVPNLKLSTIEKVVLVKPEQIRWALDSLDGRWKPYQKLDLSFNSKTIRSTSTGDLIPLNTETYKYYALNGDTEIPYGIPPYIASLDPIAVQRVMMDNIKFIIEQAGIMGFLELLMDKPDQKANENDEDYAKRLDSLLTEAKERIKETFRNGVVAGFEEDHKFNFHSISKDTKGVDSLFQLNELMVMSGLKQDGALLGRNYGTTETQITIVFTKLLSQLKNIQAIVKRNLEFGYGLELRLAGFNFKTLSVEFKQSTVLDDLKNQQAQEIKIRNANALYLDGIISQEQYAQMVGFEAPDKKKPRFIRGTVQTEAEAKQKRESGKNRSDRKVRSKNDPQGTKSRSNNI